MTARPFTVPQLERWPRGLRRAEAARYVGLSPTKFDDLVSDGRMPKPYRVDACVRWDHAALDGAIDALSDQAEQEREFVA